MGTDIAETRFSRTWFVATGLLVFMMVLFVVSIQLPHDFPYKELLRAFSEAAMVGAFADWFAVTALFRHPLGLPIPHTAIIPRNKDRIAKSFGSFIEKNFLDPEITREKLASVDIAKNLSGWLLDRNHLELGIERLRALSPLLAEVLDEPTVKRVISESLSRPFEKIELSPLVGRLLKVFAEHPEFRALTNELIGIFGELIEEQKGTLRLKVRQESPWFIPDFIDEKIYEKVLSQLRGLIVTLKDQPDHPVREALFNKLSQWADKFTSDPSYIAVGDAIRSEILSSGAFTKTIERLIESFVQSIRSNEALVTDALAHAARGLSVAVQENPSVREHLNMSIREAVVLVVRFYRTDISRFMSDVMRTWETTTLIRKIETEIGSDLQFIRINGTIVGGCIGVLIWLVEFHLGY